jgi:hypothetical protein
LEHLRLLNNFEPINGFDLPYTLELNLNKEEDKVLMKKIVQKQLGLQNKHKHLLIQNDGENLNYQIEIYKSRAKNKLKIEYDIEEKEPLNFIGMI